MSVKKHTNQIHVYNIPFPVFVQRKLKNFNIFLQEIIHIFMYINLHINIHIFIHINLHIFIHIKKQKDKNLSALSFTDADVVLHTRQQPHL